jgi:hypothetical protein
MKSIFLVFIMSLFFCHQSSAQHFEIGLGYGHSLSKIDFHHDSEVTINSNEGSQSYGNSIFNFKVSAPLYKENWYLKSELGFLKINSFLNIKYTYNEGLGEMKESTLDYLTSQKVCLSITPEFRKTYESTVVKISGGPILTADISNVLITDNKSFLPKSLPIGFRLDAGLQYNLKNVGFEFNLGYMRIGPSILQNIWHPKISYHLTVINVGVVYSINGERNENN